MVCCPFGDEIGLGVPSDDCSCIQPGSSSSQCPKIALMMIGRKILKEVQIIHDDILYQVQILVRNARMVVLQTFPCGETVGLRKSVWNPVTFTVRVAIADGNCRFDTRFVTLGFFTAGSRVTASVKETLHDYTLEHIVA